MSLLYTLLALTPLLVVFLLMVVMGRSAKLSMGAAYLVTAILALFVWGEPGRSYCCSHDQRHCYRIDPAVHCIWCRAAFEYAQGGRSIKCDSPGLYGCIAGSSHSGHYCCLVVRLPDRGLVGFRYALRCWGSLAAGSGLSCHGRGDGCVGYPVHACVFRGGWYTHAGWSAFGY